MLMVERWASKAQGPVKTRIRALNPSLCLALARAGCGGSGGEASKAIVSLDAEKVVAPSGGDTPTPTASPTPDAQPTSVTPIASNFDREPLIVPGYDHGTSKIPLSASPDVLGAFRFICTAGQMNYDDPILFPGSKGASPHLHQWYGNSDGDYSSAYPSLRGSGESTCSNKLNRSAYWIPALMNADGKVITPDYMSIYYKRRPASDPQCLKEATNGCVPLPTGLRLVSGYDMKRMGDAQPENITFYHRCISPNKPSIHRKTLADAISDCGGAGQIMSTINFGSCWNGQIDSADHRSHVVHPKYNDQGYEQCPSTHPYVIPELTQQIAYTIEAGDGDVWFSSDRMNGMTMTGGSTFHADYIEAWDPPTRETWERECLNKKLNCADGELGDGTMLKRGGLTYKAAQRLVTPPDRPKDQL